MIKALAFAFALTSVHALTPVKADAGRIDASIAVNPSLIAIAPPASSGPGFNAPDAKFSAALQVISKTTESIVQKPISTAQNVAQVFDDGGEMAQAIEAQTPRTDAQKLLLETADILRDLSYALIQGTATPTQALHDQACELTKEGLEKRRFAAYEEGYADLHQEFKDFLYQFVDISDILGCTDDSLDF